MKTCHRCRASLPPSSFAANKHKHDGLDGYCKTCRREWNRARLRSGVPLPAKLVAHYAAHSAAEFYSEDYFADDWLTLVDMNANITITSTKPTRSLTPWKTKRNRCR